MIGMTHIELALTPATGEDLTVVFDDLRFGISGKPKVIITFDDGRGSVYNKAYPIMAGNGQAGVAFVVSSLVDTGGAYMTLSNLTTLKDAGWDISNHTMTHPNLTKSTREELETEINGMYDWLVANGFRDSAKYFAYPCHDYNDDVINKVKERHVLARDGGQAIQEHFDIVNWDNIPYRLCAYGVVSTTSVRTVEALIDLTIVKSGVLILLFHNIVDSGSGGYPTADFQAIDFQAISDYLKTKQDAGLLEVITFSDYYNALIGLEPFCLKKPAMDFNDDCKVDFADFALFAQSWLECNLEPKSACWE